MGIDGVVSVDEKMEDSSSSVPPREPVGTGKDWHLHLVLLLVAAAVYLGCIVSPPSLMDDVDAVQAQIARNMLTSGDWVTARLDGVVYLEKAPLIYWTMAVAYATLGAHDWVARLPIALSAIALCWLTFAFGAWAFGKRAGFYAGLCMATCIGLFLFTRILIPDVMLTFTVALGMWAFLRALDEEEAHPRFWAFVLAANLGVGLLLKSLIGVLFPIAAGIIYLWITRQLFLRSHLAPVASHSADCWSSCSLRHRGTFSPPCAIRLISHLHFTAVRASITVFFGSISLMNNCCVS